MAVINEKPCEVVVKLLRNWNHHELLVGVQNVTGTLENNSAIS